MVPSAEGRGGAEADGAWVVVRPINTPISESRPSGPRSYPSSLIPRSNEGPAGPWLLASGLGPWTMEM